MSLSCILVVNNIKKQNRKRSTEWSLTSLIFSSLWLLLKPNMQLHSLKASHELFLTFNIFFISKILAKIGLFFLFLSLRSNQTHVMGLKINQPSSMLLITLQTNNHHSPTKTTFTYNCKQNTDFYILTLKMRRRKCGIGDLPIQMHWVRTRVNDWRSRAKFLFSHCHFEQAWKRLKIEKLHH